MGDEFIINKDGILREYHGDNPIVRIPDNVIKIKNSFNMNKYIEEVYVGKNVESIEDCAFFDCDNLKRIVYNDNLKLIGEYVFFGCCSLEEIIIPESVKEIKNKAFLSITDFKKLKIIQISDSVEKVGINAFYYPKSDYDYDYFSLYKGKIVLVENNNNILWEEMIIKALRIECLAYTYLNNNLVASESLINKIVAWLNIKKNKDLVIEVATKNNDRIIINNLNNLPKIKKNDLEKKEVLVKKEKTNESNNEILEILKKEYRISHLNFKLSSNQLNDVDFLVKVLKTNRMYFFKKVINKIIIDNEKLLNECLKESPASIMYASDKYKDNKEFMMKLLKEDGSLLKYASDRLKDDEEVVGMALQISNESAILVHDPSKHIISTENRANYIQYASDRIKNDKSLILKVVDKDGYSLQYVSDELRDDKEVVLKAVTKIGNAIRYASDRLKDDKEVVIAALKDYKPDSSVSIKEKLLYIDNNKYVFKYISDRLKDDKDVINHLSNSH